MRDGNGTRVAAWLAGIALGLGTGFGPGLPAAADPADPVFRTRPTINLFGTTGLIDMPTAESQPDGEMNATVSRFAGITRMTLTFQLLPRLSGSFRYTGFEDWDDVVPSGFSTFYDRSFDIRYQVLKERRYQPALAIGLQDFAGTGIFSGEYIVATKHLTPRLKVTGGLGWGRFASSGSIGSPFSDTRPQKDVGQGGQFNQTVWFRGPAAPFGGIEWQPTDRLGFKLELSSDDYELEAGTRKIFDRDSSLNFGAEYQVNESVRVGAYYLYGSEVGVNVAVGINPDRPPNPGSLGPAPLPVAERPDRIADPDAWAPGWIDQPGVRAILAGNLARQLAAAELELEALAVSPDAAELRFRNHRYDAPAQAAGRAARAMARVLPASVETFRIVPVTGGIPGTAVTLRRSDLEALEHAPDAGARMRALAGFSDPGPLPGAAVRPEGLYPRLSWGLGPFFRNSLFDPDNPFRFETGIRLRGKLEVTQGLELEGSVVKRVYGNLDENTRFSNSVLPRVRTDFPRFDRQGDPVIERLTLAHEGRVGPDLYARGIGGYLERMFAGVAGEVLWKPAAGPLALGLEVAYARKRDFDILFDVQDFDVVTGHASAYYSFRDGVLEDYVARIDAGRFLARDWGATIALEREFANGWKVGAFATFTDVSSEEFGEGSFDKGISIRIPLSWFTGRPSQSTLGTTLRPIQRDGVARLLVPGRLFEKLHRNDADRLEAQWERFWR